MSWESDDGQHEGYAAYVALDGRKTSTTTGAGLVMECDRSAEVLPWSMLLGWEASCSCGWAGSLWRAHLDEQDAEDRVLEDGRTAGDDILDQWRAHVARSR